MIGLGSEDEKAVKKSWAPKFLTFPLPEKRPFGNDEGGGGKSKISGEAQGVRTRAAGETCVKTSFKKKGERENLSPCEPREK